MDFEETSHVKPFKGEYLPIKEDFSRGIYHPEGKGILLRVGDHEFVYKKSGGIENHLKKLQSFGVNIPPFRNLGEKRINGIRGEVVAVAKVNGTNLVNSSLSPDNKLQAEQMVSGLTKYYLNVLQEGGLYFSDLDTRQFMYGSIRGKEPNIYLVDIELIMGKLNKAWRFADDSKNLTNFLNLGPRRVIHLLEILEKKCGVELKSSRQQLMEIKHNIPNSPNLREQIKKNSPTVADFIKL